LNELDQWHKRFDTNYRQYTAYNLIKGTESKITDPVAPELVERVIQKLFEKEPKFFVETKGANLPPEVKNVITALAEFIWSNQDMVQSTGTMRSKLKVGAREFCVTGNMAIETYWNMVSDAPDLRNIAVEDVIFNPSKNLKTSNRYYVRQFVSLDYLRDNVEIKQDGEVVTGLFKSSVIKKLERQFEDNDGFKQDPTSQQVNRSGSDKVQNVDQIPLITMYEGADYCRFVLAGDEMEPLEIQEGTNDVLKTHPLSFAMDIEVPKQPYAFSILDFLSGLIKAKNMFLNQIVDYGSKVLNPPTIVDPNVGPQNLRTVANMYKLGGIVTVPKDAISHMTMPSFGDFGFNVLDWIEGRSESVSGIGAYLAGVPNQVSDKTLGTKGGIQALISQSTSPVSDRQQNIEESIIEPFVNKSLKMMGATMSDRDFKWVLVGGESQRWVKATKGFLTGDIKLQDLMDANVIDGPEVQAMVNFMMEQGKDPANDVIFDADWIIRVETGSLAESDTQKEIENKRMVMELGVQMGVPIDAEKMWKDIAIDAGLKEPAQYLKKLEDVPVGQMGQMAPGAPPLQTPAAPQMPPQA